MSAIEMPCVLSIQTGIKGAPFIVAINKNVKAPIFQVADVGIEADILDFLSELTEKIEE